MGAMSAQLCWITNIRKASSNDECFVIKVAEKWIVVTLSDEDVGDWPGHRHHFTRVGIAKTSKA